MIKRVYIASPLFNPAELEENLRINKAIEKAGYDTFFPQRDGFLFTELVKEIEKQGFVNDKAQKLALNIIVHLDVYQACEVCDAMVLNLNGRVPDEGAVSEGALAFRSEIPLVIYKQDARSLIMGMDNPLVVGLTNFEIATTIEEIPIKLKKLDNGNESSYSKMMKNARVLFGGYKPDNKNIPELIKKSKELLS